jgi:hypothetical protein
MSVIEETIVATLAVSSEQASDEMRVFDVSPFTGLKPAQP